MSVPKIVDGWYGGSIKSDSFKTVDLPQGGTPTVPGTPAKVDVSGVTVVSVNVSLSNPARVTYATTDALGKTQLGSDTTRQLVPAGVYSFQVANLAGALYFTEVGEAANVTDGLSYHLVEGQGG